MECLRRTRQIRGTAREKGKKDRTSIIEEDLIFSLTVTTWITSVDFIRKGGVGCLMFCVCAMDPKPKPSGLQYKTKYQQRKEPREGKDRDSPTRRGFSRSRNGTCRWLLAASHDMFLFLTREEPSHGAATVLGRSIPASLLFDVIRCVWSSSHEIHSVAGLGRWKEQEACCTRMEQKASQTARSMVSWAKESIPCLG